MDQRKKDNDKFRGCFVGLAIGDALGAPVERMTAEQIKEKYGRIENYVVPENGRVKLGEWTDKTIMSLAVARGTIASGYSYKAEYIFSLIAQEHLSDWRKNPNAGYDRTTKTALANLDKGKGCYKSGSGYGVGNGVATRIAPLALWLVRSRYYRGYLKLGNFLIDSQIVSFLMTFGRITHTNPYSLIAGMLQAGIIVDFFERFSDYCIEENITRYFFAESLAGMAGHFECLYCTNLPKHQLSSKIGYGLNVKDNKIKEDLVMWDKPREGFSATASCPFAWLTAIKHAESFKDGVLAAVNAGGDAAANASMVGAILGVLHGLEAIQEETDWCFNLKDFHEIVALSDALFENFDEI